MLSISIIIATIIIITISIINTNHMSCFRADAIKGPAGRASCAAPAPRGAHLCLSLRLYCVCCFCLLFVFKFATILCAVLLKVVFCLLVLFLCYFVNINMMPLLLLFLFAPRGAHLFSRCSCLLVLFKLVHYVYVSRLLLVARISPHLWSLETDFLFNTLLN